MVVLKNLQPYTVVEVEKMTMRDFLRSHIGAEGIEDFLTNCEGTQEFLDSKVQIDRRTLTVCENSGEAARLADWANKTRYANDPNFSAKIKSERYEIIEIPTEMFNNARVTCDDCGADLVNSQGREKYICEKCGKEHDLAKIPKNMENRG